MNNQSKPNQWQTSTGGRKTWKNKFDQRSHQRQEAEKYHMTDEEDEESLPDPNAASSGSHQSGYQRRGGSNAPPPEFDGDKSDQKFDNYVIKAKLWLRTTSLEPSARGPRMLQGLKNDAFEALKHLVDDDEWMSSEENGEKLLEVMKRDDFYGKLNNEELVQSFTKMFFGKLWGKEQQGDVAATRAKFDEANRKLTRQKVQLPTEALGFLYMVKMDLIGDTPDKEERLQRILTMTNGEITLEAITKAIRRLQFKTSEKAAPKSSAQSSMTWLAETGEETGYPPPPLPYDSDQEDLEILVAAMQQLDDTDAGTTMPSIEEPIEEEDAKEILMTLIRNKYQGPSPQNMKYHQVQGMKRDIKNARGFNQIRGGKKDIEYLKKVTKCKGCGMTGHWHKDPVCPKRGGSGTASTSSGSGSRDQPVKTNYMNIVEEENSGGSEPEITLVEE